METNEINLLFWDLWQIYHEGASVINNYQYPPFEPDSYSITDKTIVIHKNNNWLQFIKFDNDIRMYKYDHEDSYLTEYANPSKFEIFVNLCWINKVCLNS